MHISERRPADNLDRVGDFFNMPSDRIDGNDAIAIRTCADKAVKRARSGEGPSVIEARTYRWKGHVDWREDDDVGLLRSDTLHLWKPAKCPIKLLERQMKSQGIDSEYFNKINKGIEQLVKKSVEFALESPFPTSEDLLKHVFVESGKL